MSLIHEMREVSVLDVAISSNLTAFGEAFQGVVCCRFVARLRLCLSPVWLVTNVTVANNTKRN